jgi:arginine decarboxylase
MTGTVIHLEDNQADRETVKRVHKLFEKAFKKFVANNFPRAEIDLELVQVRTVDELKGCLFNNNGSLTTAAARCILFLLDYFVPQRSHETDATHASSAVPLRDCSVDGLDFPTWLDTYFPAIPKVLLTGYGVRDRTIENEWFPLPKDSLNNPDDHVNVLSQHFPDWWEPTFWNRLHKYGESDAHTSFHTPGHNRGNAFQRSKLQEDFYDAYGKLVFQTDLSVSVDELGDLSEPSHDSPLSRSAKRSADIFGAKETFYITNGTSTSNKALLMSLLRPGDVVLLDRNCHKSVHQAVVVSGALPFYLPPTFNKLLGVWSPVGSRILHKYLGARYTEEVKPKLLILTTCTYEGVLYPIREIAQLCERQGILFYADEAWAPYIRFHPWYVKRDERGNVMPFSALDGGAHFAAHSTHKALAAFSQASMIHVSHKFEELLCNGASEWEWLRERFSLEGRGSYKKFRHEMLEVLRYWHSTSPNYPILATLDRAGIQMRLEGMSLLDERIRWVEDLTADVNAKSAGGIVGLEEIVGGRNADFERHLKDPLKLILGFPNMPQKETFKKELIRKHHIRWEKEAQQGVEFLITIGTFKVHLELLEQAITDGRHLLGLSPPAPEDLDSSIGAGQPEVPPQTAAYCEGTLVELALSTNRICAQMIVPFPPGIPIFLPGFRITDEMIKRVSDVIGTGGVQQVHGVLEDGGKFYVKVMKPAELVNARGLYTDRLATLSRLAAEIAR